MMGTIAVAVGTPIGILAGTYLAEYGRYTRLAFFLRFVNDILLSAPSIVLGLFIYDVMVLPMGHFSAFAGAAALTVIVIPVVVRTTENMLLLIPNTLREAAIALGATRSHVIRVGDLAAAQAGIVTGALLAIARISGETAPLLFTSLNNQFWSVNPNEPMASLPVAIFQMAMSPYEDWHRLAWSGAADHHHGGACALHHGARARIAAGAGDERWRATPTTTSRSRSGTSISITAVIAR